MNRRLLCTLASSLIATAAIAQTAALPPTTSSPAPVQRSPVQVTTPPPCSPIVQSGLPDSDPRSTVPDVTRYVNEPDLLNFSTAQVAQFKDRDADIIFIGDSITQHWRDTGEKVWDANFTPRNALDFGSAGDATQGVLWRLENYPIRRLHPKVAVVLVGTNNVYNTAQEIAYGVKAVLTTTQSIFPGIKIILVSIMPNRRANGLMMSANSILRTYADNQTIYYLDLVPLMTPIGDNWKGLGPDHLHPDAAGYQLWTDAMLPLLNKLLPSMTASSTRP